MKKFTHWLALCVAASFLAACGGGGGSPGTNSNGVAPSKAASIVLTSSAANIASSGAAGTEVTLTAVVRDGNNAALANEAVTFKTSSGTITAASATTDASGTVTAKLSVAGDSSLRDITITAADGSVTSKPVTVSVVSAVQTLTLTTSSGTLASAGVAGSEVTVVALVRDASNSVVPGVAVTLSASSGSLSNDSRVTDASGKVTLKLGTGGDPMSRAITVTATTPNAPKATVVVNVTGTSLQVTPSLTLSVGSSADITATLTDSAGNPLTNRAVTISTGNAANSVVVKNGGAAVTNGGGQVVLSFRAGASGSDTISYSALGESASTAVTVNPTTFGLQVLSAGGVVESSANIGGCQVVAISNAPAGPVSLSTSLGTVYSDATCATALTAPLTVPAGGSINAYLNAGSPGVATLTATTSSATVQTSVEFIAPLTSSATITVQSNPGVIGTNATGTTTQQATLRAVVRDGTTQNNLVKGATVVFTVLANPSGGTLVGSQAITQSDGSASINYIAGSSATATDGVRIQATIQNTTTSAVTTLTVAAKSLFISAGTGNTVASPTPQTYRLDYAIIVSDSAGNAVPGTTLTASVDSVSYYKGVMSFGAIGPWSPVYSSPPCLNEDLNRNGLLDPGEDSNGNGILDPGIPATVTPSVVTDANGQASISLTYPKDRAYWLDVNLVIRGQVAGTESRYVALVHLPGASVDYATLTQAPPGAVSPYGSANACSNPK